MKISLKTILFSSLFVLTGIQLIPVTRSNPEVVSDFDGPANVKAILKRSCYDCHSNETQWPWYSYVAPVSWLVAHDVREGREELNFSDWSRFAKDSHLIEEIFEETAEGKMPMRIYLLTHPKSNISQEDLELIRIWSEETMKDRS